MANDVNHIVTKDIASEVRELDLVQFSDSENCIKLLNVVSAQKQVMWDCFVQLAEGFLIDNAEGAQLDIIGKIMGVVRTSEDDDMYRLILKIRGYRSRTHGTRVEIIDILSRFTGVDASLIESYKEDYKAVTLAFFSGCLTPNAAAQEIRNLLPVVTSYRLIVKYGTPFVLTSLSNDEPDDQHGLTSHFKPNFSGGYLGSLIAASK